MPVPGRRVAVRLLAIGAYAALAFASAPGWPDDWDGIGFLESIGDFDLARFQPHPPGYPVYVALLRAAFLATRDAMRAAQLIAVLSGVASLSFVWDGVRRVAGERTAWIASAFVAVAPLTWRTCSGVGSEAPALACLAACGWALAPRESPVPRRHAAWVLGLGCGLGLGVRLSWAPLYLAALAAPAALRLAPAEGGQRARSWGVALAACLAWAVPLAASVGPTRLGALVTEHFVGHALRWGGTVATEPGGVRVVWLARDILEDGLGAGDDALGLAIAILLTALVVLAAVAWKEAPWKGGSRRAGRLAAVLLAPYTLWIGLGQNLRDQPRHVLPLVVALALATAVALALAPGRSRCAPALVAALGAAMAIRTGRDACARRSIPPSGEQLVTLALAQPRPDRLAVFGAASLRFFERSDVAHRPAAGPMWPTWRVAGSMGDVQLALTRLDALPARVWVTSEIAGRADVRGPLSQVASLCRPSRIDRRLPCLEVYEWAPRYLPAE